jgi:colanic acid/amylovoran biosynthesis glycosyltransferase
MKLSIAVYDTAESCGGPYSWAPQFMENMASRGIEIHAVILGYGSSFTSNIATFCERSGINYDILFTDNAPTLDEQAEWILAKWKANPTEIFIANLVLPALIAAKWIRSAGGKTIGILHSNPTYDPFYHDFITHFVDKESELTLTTCVSVSKHIAEQIKTICHPGAQTIVIPCGAMTSEQKAKPPKDELRVMYCGRLVQEAKRIRDVTDAMLQTVCELPYVRCNIYGSGPEEQWIKERIRDEPKIQILGRLSPQRVREEMLSHHVIILLSDYEGLPISLIEGMLSGLVPIYFAEPSGSQEVVHHEINGFLVNDRKSSVVEAIKRLSNPQTWEKMSQNAINHCESEYSYDIVMNKWCNLVKSLSTENKLDLNNIPTRLSIKQYIRPGAFNTYHPCRNEHSPGSSSKTRRFFRRIFKIFFSKS